MTAILQASKKSIQEAAKQLSRGEVVAIPTETVYGLAANALNADAILRVFEVKERPHFDPLIIHTTKTQFSELDNLVDQSRLSPNAYEHAHRLTSLWPGPLTLVLPKHSQVPDLATSGFDTVAIRSPAHPIARAIIDTLGHPVVAPSANQFSRISPTTAAHVYKELGGRISLIVDAGPASLGIESTIVGIEDEGIARLLRPGATPVEKIENLLGMPLKPPLRNNAPGMSASHYAPRKPLVLEGNSPLHGRLAWLLFQDSPKQTWRDAYGPPIAIEILKGSSNDVARELFGALRRLDESPASWILAENYPFRQGMGLAIQDRLERASFR